MTVGEESGTLGYDKSDSLGSISTERGFRVRAVEPAPQTLTVDRE